MVVRGVSLFAVLLAFGVLSCADVWGFDTLNVSDGALENQDAGPGSTDGGGMVDGERPRNEGGILDDGSHHFEASSPQDAVASGDSAISATCGPDPSVSCSDPAYAGFSCTGGGQPSTFFTGLTCSNQGTSGDETAYCCIGNFCGDTGQNDPCDSCFLANCTAPDCVCFATGPTVDSSGDTACGNYVNCWNTCYFQDNGPSVAACESQCGTGLGSDTISMGDSDIACMENYCSSACGF